MITTSTQEHVVRNLRQQGRFTRYSFLALLQRPYLLTLGY